jgi:sterol desaturase/sphingolipid hydroxylase (fatty acid hydroxylase superfamily)
VLASEYIDLTTYAIPGFALLVALEAWWLADERRRGDRRGYERRDTWASILMGVGSTVFVLALQLGVLAIADRLWRFRITDLGSGWAGWTVAIVGWDLAYYWQHRAEHEIRLLWACHVNHHSSRHYNLSTAIRQPWTPWTHLVFYPGLALLGVRPWMILAAEGIDLIYQFWIHTEAIDRMPRWFEFVFNTPSHHRVHHGSNPEYLDRNYGGILIVFDRLFGTFEPEVAPVRYGLTKDIVTFNPLRIATHEYVALARDVRHATTWRRRVAHLLRGPGWRPATAAAST